MAVATRQRTDDASPLGGGGPFGHTAGRLARQPRGGYDAARQQAFAGYLFIAPAMLVFFVFTLIPVGVALYLSFTNYDVFTKMDWIGVANYQDVFDDEFFWRAFWNTLRYTVGTIPLSMVIGLGLAMLLNQKLRGLGAY